ncbi:MAG: hypothetical protein KDE31_21115, partial [Caldilineaceae bacterium]|nr:hypothetical protein [Caldilineaceae bacterium]
MEKDNYVRGSVGGRLSQVMYKRSGWTVNCIVDRGSDGQERATYVLRTSDRHQSSLAPLVNKLRRGVDFDVNSPELPHVIEYRMEADPPLQELELANLRGKTIGHETLRTWSEREFLVFAKSFCDTLLTYQDAGITGVGVRLDEVLWAESEKRVFLLGWEHSRIDDTQPVDMKTAANLWIELLTGHDLETSPHTYRAGPDWEQVSLGLRALLMRMHSSSIDLKRVIHHIARLLDMHSAEQDLFDEALLLDPVQALIAYDFLQRAGPSRNRLLPALQAAKRATDRLVESK